ncbi:Methionine synthase [Moorella thermoacetica]|uniref:Methionine synthase n=2 Tax=Neomoorella thermoacetica TaxID=1525 RepID=A0A1D7XAK1_NEOTH|nr:corrinoid protein [Moorella thermoacetica]AOQ23932.1 Methionine synthase [Moorella thermoacetica]OIQ09323.1 methionine synthase [Moorella thermoacetica]OIQ12884.1 methionine synthase [Moorella thermoacetica]OIQ61833.1 methionine synthase [Moorella thermoacetica]TYL14336.1 Methionine synthase [Moorella thermoacetica]
MPTYEELSQAVFEGDEAQVVELTRSLLSGGAEPLEVINKGLIAGMDRVGVLFKNNEMFVPEVLMSANAMNAGVEVVKQSQQAFDMPSVGKIVLGTVKGDLHDIGKNLVAMMLESGGFTVYNLGVDIEPGKFVEAVKKYQPDIVGMSALLTTTMMNMKSTIDALIAAGLRDRVKVIVGGAPLSQDFADEIGADGYAPDAASATELCRRLLE